MNALLYALSAAFILSWINKFTKQNLFKIDPFTWYLCKLEEESFIFRAGSSKIMVRDLLPTTVDNNFQDSWASKSLHKSTVTENTPY